MFWSNSNFFTFFFDFSNFSHFFHLSLFSPTFSQLSNLSPFPGYLLLINGLIGSVIAEVMWLYGVLYTSSLIGTMALTLQIPLSIIADSFVRGASYSPMFNIGATCIFMAFIFVTISTHTMMPRNKIKVPRKVRHFCCCTESALEIRFFSSWEGGSVFGVQKTF